MHAAILNWPAQERERCELARAGLPRILVVPRDGPRPTATGDPLEDWVTEPVDEVELRVRASIVEKRFAARAPRPFIDGDDLCFVDARVRVTAREHAMLVPLLVRAGEPVDRELVNRAYVDAGGDAGPDAFRSAVSRLRRRLTPLGLKVHVLHSRALMLEVHKYDVSAKHARNNLTGD